jgi:hypothetical protein
VRQGIGVKFYPNLNFMAMGPERIGIAHTWYRLFNALGNTYFLLGKFRN